MLDPYQQVTDRNPGAICTQNYECKSKNCSPEGVCSVPQHNIKTTNVPSMCVEHTDCNVGFFCANSYLQYAVDAPNAIASNF